MGQRVSVPSNSCVSIAEYDSLINETYTVERSSGQAEAGWKVGSYHECAGGCPEWINMHASKHAQKEPGTWRIFMQNSETDPESHACAWRRIDAIVPTRLVGDNVAACVWRENIIQLLDLAEETRTPIPST